MLNKPSMETNKTKNNILIKTKTTNWKVGKIKFTSDKGTSFRLVNGTP